MTNCLGTENGHGAAQAIGNKGFHSTGDAVVVVCLTGPKSLCARRLSCQGKKLGVQDKLLKCNHESK